MNNIDSRPTLNTFDSWNSSSSSTTSNKTNESLNSASPPVSVSSNSSPVSLLPSNQYFNPSNVSSPTYVDNSYQSYQATNTTPYWSTKNNYYHLNQQSNYSFIAAVAANYPHLQQSQQTAPSYYQSPNQFYAQDNMLFNQLAVAAAASNSNSPLSFTSNKSPQSNLIHTTNGVNIDTSSVSHNDSGFESPKLNDKLNLQNVCKVDTTTSPKLNDDAINRRQQAWTATSC